MNLFGARERFVFGASFAGDLSVLKGCRYLAWLECTHVPPSGGANGSRDVLCFMRGVQLPVTDTPATQYSN